MNLDHFLAPTLLQLVMRHFDGDVYSLCQIKRTKMSHHHGQRAQPVAGSPQALMVAPHEKHVLHQICRSPYQTQLWQQGFRFDQL
jgi:hypothetical protein